MSYVGGKARNGAHILRVLNHSCFDGFEYVEPFVGMGHLLRRVHSKASYRASDSDTLLITLLQAVQRGDPLPEQQTMTRERYAQLKRGEGTPLERAVAAFQWSFNGKKWGGFVHTYTRPNGRVDDIPLSRARYYASLRANRPFQQTILSCADYRATVPRSSNTLVMCDPPYAGTMEYHDGAFDSAAFWEWAARMSERCVVLVSEYDAPAPWVEVGRSEKRCCVSGGHRQSPRTERLFAHPLALERVAPLGRASELLTSKSVSFGPARAASQEVTSGFDRYHPPTMGVAPRIEKGAKYQHSLFKQWWEPGGERGWDVVSERSQYAIVHSVSDTRVVLAIVSADLVPTGQRVATRRRAGHASLVPRAPSETIWMPWDGVPVDERLTRTPSHAAPFPPELELCVGPGGGGCMGAP